MKNAMPLFLLSWLFLMFSCKEDDLEMRGHEHAEHTMIKNKVSFEKMKKYLSNHTNSPLPSYFEPAHNRGNDTFITAIDTTNIVQITNGDVTTFTLHVNTLDDQLYAYSNLVMKLNNGESEESILHYNPTPEWQAAFDSGERLPYEGDLDVTNTDGEAKRSSCMIEVNIACYGETCPCEDFNGQTFYIEIPCGGGDVGNPTDPNPGGYDPYDDGPGGGGGSGNPETPCEQLESRSSDATFKVKMNELKNNRNGTREKGFLMFSGTPKYSPTITGDEYGNVDYGTQNVQNPAGLGGAHNHLSGANHIAVFTPEDLCVFATIANYTQEPIENLAYYLASPEGFYAIKIQDVGNLLNFAVNYLNDNEYHTQVLEAYDRKKIIHGKPKADQEKGFLEIIHKFHINLDVYECDANYNNWKKLTLNTSGAVVKTPC